VRAAKKDIKLHDFLTQPKSSYIIFQHYLLLSRNLVYTGLTRAKQLAILVGPTKTIGISIKRVTDRQRYTALADRLRGSSTSSSG
jgi:ATP-dependent exoDNAse (exonuclease V) alpha subunit